MRRIVFFVSGFDPAGPRRYRGFFREAAAKRGGVETGPLRRDADGIAARWAARAGGREAEVVFLRWDDLARARMRRSLLRLHLDLARAFRAYVLSGAFAALFRLRRVPTLVGLWPPSMMLVFLAAAAGLGWAAGSLAASALGPAGWAAAPAAFLLAMRASRASDGALLVHYLMADLAFTADHAAGRAPEMEARLDAFARRIGAARREGWGEVLVVGHSSGAALAALAADRALAGPGAGPGARLSLLTFGQTIPMLSFLPGAAALRAALGRLGASEALDWIDVSSPWDGGCFALADPVSVSGARVPGAPERNPKVLSARFGDRLSAEARRALRWRWLRRHALYFAALDGPRDCDWLEIVTGPSRLAERFAGRRPSPQAERRAFRAPERAA